MPIDLTKTREEFTRIHAEAEAVVNTATAANRGLTKEEGEGNATRFARMTELKTLLDNESKLAALAFANDTNVQRPTFPKGKDEQERADGGAPNLETTRQEFAKALKGWAANGEVGEFVEKFATITTATQSGVYLPKNIAAPLIPTSANTFRDAIMIQGMENVTLVSTATSAALTVPVVTGTAGGQVAENAAAETDGTPGLTESIDLTAKTYQSGSVYYSNLVLAAGALDIVNGVVPVLAYEKELGLESQIVTTIKADAGITQAVTLAAATAASITFAKMQALNRLLPKRFDTKKVILLGDDSYSALESLVDGQGRPILAQDTQNQELKRFLGTPVLRCSYFDAIAGAKVIGAVISLLGFRLRDVDGTNLARYDQVPAKPNQVGFNLFSYHGYGYAASAMGLLKTP